jgi:hypothetical protein
VSKIVQDSSGHSPRRELLELKFHRTPPHCGSPAAAPAQLDAEGLQAFTKIAEVAKARSKARQDADGEA